MYANLDLNLTKKYLHHAPAREIAADIKAWLYRKKPTCLMHPHGFYVVHLGRSDMEEWRFHFWPKGTRNITGMPARIHTHNRRIESRILQGTLSNTLYDVEATSAGGRPLYETKYLGDRHSSTTSNLLIKTGKYVYPIIRRRDTLNRGDLYCIEANTYHEVEVPHHLGTATLVCMHKHTSEPSLVIGLDGYPEKISFKRTEHLSVEFLEKLISLE